jgi:hypothetical protein
LPARLLAMRGYPRHNLLAGLAYRLCFHKGNRIRLGDRMRASQAVFCPALCW